MTILDLRSRLAAAASVAATAALLAGAPSAARAAVLTQGAVLAGATTLVLPTVTGPTGKTGVAYTQGGETVSFGTSNAASTFEIDNSSTTLVDNNYSANTALLAVCGVSTHATCGQPGNVVVGFTTPVTGFSFAIDDYDGSQSYKVTAFGLTGPATGYTRVGSIVATSIADSGASAAILEATSSVPLTGVVFLVTPTNGSVGDPDLVIGNVQYTTGVIAAVPEPASMALLGVGLAGLIAVGRRKRG